MIGADICLINKEVGALLHSIFPRQVQKLKVRLLTRLVRVMRRLGDILLFDASFRKQLKALMEKVCGVPSKETNTTGTEDVLLIKQQ